MAVSTARFEGHSQAVAVPSLVSTLTGEAGGVNNGIGVLGLSGGVLISSSSSLCNMSSSSSSADDDIYSSLPLILSVVPTSPSLCDTASPKSNAGRKGTAVVEAEGFSSSRTSASPFFPDKETRLMRLGESKSILGLEAVRLKRDNMLQESTRFVFSVLGDRSECSHSRSILQDGLNSDIRLAASSLVSPSRCERYKAQTAQACSSPVEHATNTAPPSSECSFSADATSSAAIKIAS
mmetsp:Transcript_14277/g.20100  ORF Transcript_14277/g.20100 Transcript_14277/m.20100 type:complete len:237 (-) Transcript_14277:1752-2462(-)